MFISKKSMPRRTFLRGAGASLALPFLDAMIPAFAASTGAALPPLKLGFIYLPVGRIMENWTPKVEGSGYEITPSLEPLAAFREQMLVISGLDVKAADLLPGERGGPHARPCAAFLTGAHPFPDRVGISFDQLAAKHMGRDTPLASMELGIDPPEWAGQGVGDYSGFYTSTMSWRSSTTPLPTQNNPRKVFERLFGDTDTLDPEAMHRRLANKSSVLDSVSERVNRMMASVSPEDQYKLDEYLDAVREIERGIQVAESRQASGYSPTADKNIIRPAGIPSDYAEHGRIMYDMMYLAYQTNMTRVIAFMLGHEGTNRNYTELGANDGHHSMSHHKGDPTAIEQLKKVDRYQSELLAYFFGKMQATKEIDGTSLLDNSAFVVGSGLSDGNNHVHNDVPVAVVGGAQGKIRGGRHLRYAGEPLSNLHMTMMDMFDVPVDEYYENETADATGTLPGIA
jgi:hypothetical protein